MFSFIFMDFKITVENSLPGDRLPHPGGRPCVSRPAVDRDAGAEQCCEPAGKTGRHRGRYCSHREWEIFFPLFGFPLAMRVNINDLKCD